jgi:hypothetical protein
MKTDDNMVMYQNLRLRHRELSTLSIPPPNGGGVFAELGWALCSEHIQAALSGIGRIAGTGLNILIIMHPVFPLLPLDV